MLEFSSELTDLSTELKILMNKNEQYEKDIANIEKQISALKK